MSQKYDFGYTKPLNILFGNIDKSAIRQLLYLVRSTMFNEFSVDHKHNKSQLTQYVVSLAVQNKHKDFGQSAVQSIRSVG